MPPVGFTVDGQDPEELDELHLQIYAEQLNNIIGQKRQRRIMMEYRENLVPDPRGVQGCTRTGLQGPIRLRTQVRLSFC